MSFAEFHKVKIEITRELVKPSPLLKLLGRYFTDVNEMIEDEGDLTVEAHTEFGKSDTGADLIYALSNLDIYKYINITAQYEYYRGDLYIILAELAEQELMNAVSIYDSDFETHCYTFGKANIIPIEPKESENNIWYTGATIKSIIDLNPDTVSEDDVETLDIESTLQELFGEEIYDTLFDEVDFDYADTTYEEDHVSISIETSVWRELDLERLNTLLKAYTKAKKKLAKKGIRYTVECEGNSSITLVNAEKMTHVVIDFKKGKFKTFGYTFSPLQSNPKILNKSFVFTGTLESMTRASASTLVKQNGGKTAEEVSSTTAYLVMGDQDYRKFVDGKESSKTKKAKALQSSGGPIQIIDESEFLKLLSR